MWVFVMCCTLKICVYTVLLYVSLLAGQEKCCTKRCLELQNNGAGHMTFVVWMPCQPVCQSGYVYISLSGFLTIHPDLVLFTSYSCNEAFLSCELLVPLSLPLSGFLLYCSMFASCWTNLLVLCSLCCSYVFFVFLTCLVPYIAGFLLILFSISASGSVLMLDCLF